MVITLLFKGAQYTRRADPEKLEDIFKKVSNWKNASVLWNICKNLFHSANGCNCITNPWLKFFTKSDQRLTVGGVMKTVTAGLTFESKSL